MVRQTDAKAHEGGPREKWYRGGQERSDTVHGYQRGRSIDTPIMVGHVVGWLAGLAEHGLGITQQGVRGARTAKARSVLCKQVDLSLCQCADGTEERENWGARFQMPYLVGGDPCSGFSQRVRAECWQASGGVVSQGTKSTLGSE